MENNRFNLKHYFKLNKTIHISMAVGMILFAGVLMFIYHSKGARIVDDKLKQILLVLSAILTISSILAGNFITKKKLQHLNLAGSLMEKLTAYRTILIIGWALLEGPALFSMVVFQLSGDFLFIGIAGFLVLYFFTLYPSKYKAISDLNLGLEEKRIIERNS